MIVFFKDTFREAGNVEFMFQRLAKRNRGTPCGLDQRTGIESTGLDHIIHLSIGIGRENGQRITRPILQPGSGEAHFKMLHLLGRADFV